MIPGLKKLISVSRANVGRQSVSNLIGRPRTNHKLRRALLPAALVLMVLAFSCTRPSEDNNSPNRTTIKIGYFGDLTGPTFNFGQSAINGVLMATSEVNQAGGINGRQIDVVIEDDKGSPEEAA